MICTVFLLPEVSLLAISEGPQKCYTSEGLVITIITMKLLTNKVKGLAGDLNDLNY